MSSYEKSFKGQEKNSWQDKSLSELEGEFVVEKIQNFAIEFCKTNNIDLKNLTPEKKVEIDQKLENLAKAYYNEKANEEYNKDLSGQSKSRKIGKAALMAGISIATMAGIFGSLQIFGAEQYVKFISRFLFLGIPTAKAIWMSVKMKTKYKKLLDRSIHGDVMPADLRLILEDELMAQINPDKEKPNDIMTGIRKVQGIMDSRTKKLKKKRWWKNLGNIFGKKDVLENPLGVSSLAFVSRNILRGFTHSNSGVLSGATIGVVMGAVSAGSREWKNAIHSLKSSLDHDIAKEKEESHKIPDEKIKEYLRFLDSRKLARKEPILYRKLGALVKRHLGDVEGFNKFMSSKDENKDYQNDKYFEAKAYGADIENFRNRISGAITHVSNVVTTTDSISNKRKFDKNKLATILKQGAIGTVFGFAMDQVSHGFNNMIKHETVEAHVAEDHVDYLHDSDGDGLPDVYEKEVLGTNPDAVDSDGDGISDFQELQDETNPADPNSYLEVNHHEDAPIKFTSDDSKYTITLQEKGDLVGSYYQGGRTILMKEYAGELGIDTDNLTPQSYAKIIVATDKMMDLHPLAHGDGANLEGFGGVGKELAFDKDSIVEAIKYTNENPDIVDTVASKWMADEIDLDLARYQNRHNLTNAFVRDTENMHGDYYNPKTSLSHWKANHTINETQPVADTNETNIDHKFHLMSWHEIGDIQKMMTGISIMISAIAAYIGASDRQHTMKIGKSRQVFIDVAKGAINTAVAAALLVKLGVPSLAFAMTAVNIFKMYFVDKNKETRISSKVKDLMDDKNTTLENVKLAVLEELESMKTVWDKLIPTGHSFRRNAMAVPFVSSFVENNGIRFSDVKFLQDQKVDSKLISNIIFDMIKEGSYDIDPDNKRIILNEAVRITINGKKYIFKYIPAEDDDEYMDDYEVHPFVRISTDKADIRLQKAIDVVAAVNNPKEIINTLISKEFLLPVDLHVNKEKNSLYLDGVKFNTNNKKLDNIRIDINQDREVIFTIPGYNQIDVHDLRLKLKDGEIYLRHSNNITLEKFLLNNLVQKERKNSTQKRKSTPPQIRKSLVNAKLNKSGVSPVTVKADIDNAGSGTQSGPDHEIKINKITKTLKYIEFYKKIPDIIENYNTEEGLISEKDIDEVIKNNVARLNEDDVFIGEEYEVFCNENVSRDAKIKLLLVIIRKVLRTVPDYNKKINIPKIQILQVENTEPDEKTETISWKDKHAKLEIRYENIPQFLEDYTHNRLDEDEILNIISAIANKLLNDGYLVDGEYDNLIENNIDGATVSVVDKINVLKGIIDRKNNMDGENIVAIDPQDEIDTIETQMKHLAKLRDREGLLSYIREHLQVIEKNNIQVPNIEGIDGGDNKDTQMTWKNIKEGFQKAKDASWLLKRRYQKKVVKYVLELVDSNYDGTGKKISIDRDNLITLETGALSHQWLVIEQLLEQQGFSIS